jgi:hypothetical protein
MKEDYLDPTSLSCQHIDLAMFLAASLRIELILAKKFVNVKLLRAPQDTQA